MFKSSPSLRRFGFGAACIAISVLFAACASDRGPRYGVANSDRDAVPPPPPPEMETHGTFLGGTIDVAVVLNRAGFGHPGGHSGGGREASDGRGSFGGGFGGRRGGRRGGNRGGESDEGENGSGTPAIHMVASNEPPVALHLRLTNHAAAPVEVTVPDFESDLGNFVVQPEKITVPANGSAEADPMTSQLGVMEAEIALTVTLRANGQTDHQVLMLHSKPPPPAPAAAPQPGA